MKFIIIPLGMSIAVATAADDVELAMKLSNPIADLISAPIQSDYDWRDSQWTVPVNFQVSQLVKFGSQPVQLFAGIRAYPEAPDDGPEWGVRFGMTFLFPKS